MDDTRVMNPAELAAYLATVAREGETAALERLARRVDASTCPQTRAE